MEAYITIAVARVLISNPILGFVSIGCYIPKNGGYCYTETDIMVQENVKTLTLLERGSAYEKNKKTASYLTRSAVIVITVFAGRVTNVHGTRSL